MSNFGHFLENATSGVQNAPIYSSYDIVTP